MDQSSEHIGVLLTFLVAVSIAGLILFLNKILGPKHKGSEVKAGPFECGVIPFESPAKARFSVKFYLFRKQLEAAMRTHESARGDSKFQSHEPSEPMGETIEVEYEVVEKKRD